MSKAKGKRADREADRRWLLGFVNGVVVAHGGGVIEFGDWSADYLLSTPYGPLKVVVRADPDKGPDIFQRFDTDAAREAGFPGVGFTGKWNYHLPDVAIDIEEHANAWGRQIGVLMRIKPHREAAKTEADVAIPEVLRYDDEPPAVLAAHVDDRR